MGRNLIIYEEYQENYTLVTRGVKWKNLVQFQHSRMNTFTHLNIHAWVPFHPHHYISLFQFHYLSMMTFVHLYDEVIDLCNHAK